MIEAKRWRIIEVQVQGGDDAVLFSYELLLSLIRKRGGEKE